MVLFFGEIFWADAQGIGHLLKDGIREFRENNMAIALDYFQQVLELEGDNDVALYYSGVSYLSLYDPQMALQHLQKVRTLQEDQEYNYYLAKPCFKMRTSIKHMRFYKKLALIRKLQVGWPDYMSK